MSAQLSPEDVVRKFFDCYTNGRPEDFDEVVAPDYLDYGHTPPGRGPGGARDDYENAVKQAGAVIGYTIDALVADGEMVAAAWTGTLPGGAEIGKGLSLYRTSGGLLRSTRHALTSVIHVSPDRLPDHVIDLRKHRRSTRTNWVRAESVVSAVHRRYPRRRVTDRG